MQSLSFDSPLTVSQIWNQGPSEDASKEPPLDPKEQALKLFAHLAQNDPKNALNVLTFLNRTLIEEQNFNPNETLDRLLQICHCALSQGVLFTKNDPLISETVNCLICHKLAKNDLTAAAQLFLALCQLKQLESAWLLQSAWNLLPTIMDSEPLILTTWQPESVQFLLETCTQKVKASKGEAMPIERLKNLANWRLSVDPKPYTREFAKKIDLPLIGLLAQCADCLGLSWLLMKNSLVKSIESNIKINYGETVTDFLVYYRECETEKFRKEIKIFRKKTLQNYPQMNWISGLLDLANIPNTLESFEYRLAALLQKKTTFSTGKVDQICSPFFNRCDWFHGENEKKLPECLDKMVHVYLAESNQTGDRKYLQMRLVALIDHLSNTIFQDCQFTVSLKSIGRLHIVEAFLKSLFTRFYTQDPKLNIAYHKVFTHVLKYAIENKDMREIAPLQAYFYGFPDKHNVRPIEVKNRMAKIYGQLKNNPSKITGFLHEISYLLNRRLPSPINPNCFNSLRNLVSSKEFNRILDAVKLLESPTYKAAKKGQKSSPPSLRKEAAFESLGPSFANEILTKIFIESERFFYSHPDQKELIELYDTLCQFVTHAQHHNQQEPIIQSYFLHCLASLLMVLEKRGGFQNPFLLVKKLKSLLFAVNQGYAKYPQQFAHLFTSILQLIIKLPSSMPSEESVSYQQDLASLCCGIPNTLTSPVLNEMIFKLFSTQGFLEKIFPDERIFRQVHEHLRHFNQVVLSECRLTEKKEGGPVIEQPLSLQNRIPEEIMQEFLQLIQNPHAEFDQWHTMIQRAIYLKNPYLNQFLWKLLSDGVLKQSNLMSLHAHIWLNIISTEITPLGLEFLEFFSKNSNLARLFKLFRAPEYAAFRAIFYPAFYRKCLTSYFSEPCLKSAKSHANICCKIVAELNDLDELNPNFCRDISSENIALFQAVLKRYPLDSTIPKKIRNLIFSILQTDQILTLGIDEFPTPQMFQEAFKQIHKKTAALQDSSQIQKAYRFMRDSFLFWSQYTYIDLNFLNFIVKASLAYLRTFYERLDVIADVENLRSWIFAYLYQLQKNCSVHEKEILAQFFEHSCLSLTKKLDPNSSCFETEIKFLLMLVNFQIQSCRNEPQKQAILDMFYEKLLDAITFNFNETLLLHFKLCARNLKYNTSPTQYWKHFFVQAIVFNEMKPPSQMDPENLNLKEAFKWILEMLYSKGNAQSLNRAQKLFNVFGKKILDLNEYQAEFKKIKSRRIK